MQYIAVQWHHQDSSDPVLLYSEIDGARREVRKVECFADGRCNFADDHHSSGDTMLGLEPLPPLEQIAADPEFTPREIPFAEFEMVWRRAQNPPA